MRPDTDPVLAPPTIRIEPFIITEGKQDRSSPRLLLIIYYFETHRLQQPTLF